METVIDDLEKLDVLHDRARDVLYISFGPPSKADDSELTEHDIIVRRRKGKLIGLTVLDFSRMGITISRRTAFQDVCNKNRLSLQMDSLNHLGQQLTRSANEWESLSVFFRARCLSHKNQTGLRVAGTENDGVPVPNKLPTFCATSDLISQLVKILIGCKGLPQWAR
jgi:hypothetical protein